MALTSSAAFSSGFPWCFGWSPAFCVCLYVMVLVVIMHRANIGRLLRGEEKKFSLGKK